MAPSIKFVVERVLSDSKKSDNKPMRSENAVEPHFDPIAAALRQLHDGIASEPVPDEFLKLLDQLEDRMAETAKKPS